MTVTIRDSDGTTRLIGVDVLAPGGTTGDVLTQQADGTFAPAAGGGAQTVSVATVNVSSAELLDLHNNSKSLVAAQGSGKVIVPLAVGADYKFNSIAYTGANVVWYVTTQANWDNDLGDPACEIQAGDTGAPNDLIVDVTENRFAGGWSNASATTHILNAAAREDFDNQALVLVGNGALAAGDGTVRVTVLYYVLTLS